MLTNGVEAFLNNMDRFFLDGMIIVVVHLVDLDIILPLHRCVGHCDAVAQAKRHLAMDATAIHTGSVLAAEVGDGKGPVVMLYYLTMGTGDGGIGDNNVI